MLKKSVKLENYRTQTQQQLKMPVVTQGYKRVTVKATGCGFDYYSRK